MHDARGSARLNTAGVVLGGIETGLTVSRRAGILTSALATGLRLAAMNSANRYTRCPIVEALLDIHVDLPGDFPPRDLLKCHSKVKKDYPQQRESKELGVNVVWNQGATTTSQSTRHSGYSFVSADGKQVFQARLDGFTFNRLAPYPGWEPFFTEAQRLWEVYRRVTHPRGYKRVGVRNINQFNLPGPRVELDDYFQTKPTVAEDLPQSMNNYFFKVQLPLEEIGAAVEITQTNVSPTEFNKISIILDIDLFRQQDLPTGPDLWPLFERFRIWKNKIFEACITQRIRELIQ